MDRREFLWVSAGGVGCLGLGSLGCAAPREADGAGELRLHGVGDAHLVFDADSVEYELDREGHRVLDLNDSQAVEASFGALGDGRGDLNYPIAGAVGADGRLYVLERGNSRVHVFTREGSPAGTFGRYGAGPGELSYPSDLAIGPDGEVYVADTHNHRVAVFEPDGVWRRAIGEFGTGDGQLNGPRSLAITSSGLLHVVDAGNARVQVFSLDGAYRGSYGRYGDAPGELRQPTSIVATGDRTFVADPASGQVNVFTDTGAFVTRQQPTDERGRPAAPLHLHRAPGGRIYVCTDGYAAAPTSN